MRANLIWCLLSFRGRINRQEFWLGFVGLILAAHGLKSLLETFFLGTLRPRSGPWDRDALEFALALPKIVLGLAMAWPIAAVCAKRVHDMNVTAWWLLLFPPATAVAAMAGLGAWNIPFWISLGILGLVPGTRSSNRFGV